MLKSYKNILLIILAVFVVFAAGIVLMPKQRIFVKNEVVRDEKIQVNYSNEEYDNDINEKIEEEKEKNTDFGTIYYEDNCLVRYWNKVWGLEFKYEDPNKKIKTVDLNGSVNVSTKYIYNHTDIRYREFLYINFKASDKISNFESLKNFVNENNQNRNINETKVFINDNGIKMYEVNVERGYNYIYFLYNGLIPHNYISIFYRDGEDDVNIFSRQIINSIKFVDIEKNIQDSFFEKHKVNPDCVGWYAFNKYGVKSELIKLLDIEDISNNKEYNFYDDGDISFYYPGKWNVAYDEPTKLYEITYVKNLKFRFSIASKNDFIKVYEECLGRCFDDADPTAPLSWKAYGCSEDYSEDSLNKIFSGNYMDYIHTGPRPPGGTGGIRFNLFFGEQYITAGFSNEDYQYYPKARELYNKGRWSTFTEEEKKIINDEREYYEQEFYKIIKSIKLLKIKTEKRR